MTLAPRSASCLVANGAATACSTATTVTPVRVLPRTPGSLAFRQAVGALRLNYIGLCCGTGLGADIPDRHAFPFG